MSLQRQGDQGRIEGPNDLTHGRIARHRQLTCVGVGADKAMQGGDTRAWPSERQPFDERHRLNRGSAHTPIDARLRDESGDATYPVELVPALQGSNGDPGLPGEDRERDLVFDMQPKNTPPLGRIHESYTFVLSRAARAC